MFDFELGEITSEKDTMIAVIENAMDMGLIEKQDISKMSEREIEKLFAKVIN